MSVIRPAAYPLNAAVAQLRTSEMFVVCATRLWVARFRNPAENTAWASRDLERGFAAAGVADEGLVGLCRFFDTVVVAAERALDIRCMKCPHLGEDEGLLLQAVSLLQQGYADGAAAMLDDWLPPAALRLALTPLGWFADALTESGLVVLRRHGEWASLDASPAMACSDRGVALVH